jgi:arylsulfatase
MALINKIKPMKNRILLMLAMVLTVAAYAQDKPNILVIWGDDIGIWNISHNNRGMMGYKTPNIDRIAKEGISFTDYYGQQSCTAGRAAFLGGNVPVRTGMTKVGMPGAKEGWQASDVTIATVLKSQGYATGQFGKNHQGDLDGHLPTMHGFDEFFGNLYHLNAEEEPENEDYPTDLVLANGKKFKDVYGPRGVLHTYSDGKGGQKIEDTGALTKERMETIDYETIEAAKAFITEQAENGQPFFTWWNATRMHFRTHVKEDMRHPGNDEYTDGMIEHDMHVGQLLDLLDELGIADNTIVIYSTDNGPHFNTWPDAATTPFHGEKNSSWEGAYRVPAFVKWPGHFPEDVTLNGIVSHEDWLPTLAAVAGEPNISEKLRKGVRLNGREYKNYIDGVNQLDYLMGNVEESPRTGFIYVDDAGDVAALRYQDWKAMFLVNRAHQLQIWMEPFIELRAPYLFNLRRDPFEKALKGSNTYYDWYIDRAYVLIAMQGYALNFLSTFQEYPPSQTAGDWSLSKVQEQINDMAKPISH